MFVSGEYIVEGNLDTLITLKRAINDYPKSIDLKNTFAELGLCDKDTDYPEDTVLDNNLSLDERWYDAKIIMKNGSLVLHFHWSDLYGSNRNMEILAELPPFAGKIEGVYCRSLGDSKQDCYTTDLEGKYFPEQYYINTCGCGDDDEDREDFSLFLLNKKELDYFIKEFLKLNPHSYMYFLEEDGRIDEIQQATGKRWTPS